MQGFTCFSADKILIINDNRNSTSHTPFNVPWLESRHQNRMVLSEEEVTKQPSGRSPLLLSSKRG